MGQLWKDGLYTTAIIQRIVVPIIVVYITVLFFNIFRISLSGDITALQDYGIQMCISTTSISILLKIIQFNILRHNASIAKIHLGSSCEFLCKTIVDFRKSITSSYTEQTPYVNSSADAMLVILLVALSKVVPYPYIFYVLSMVFTSAMLLTILQIRLYSHLVYWRLYNSYYATAYSQAVTPVLYCMAERIRPMCVKNEET